MDSAMKLGTLLVFIICVNAATCTVQQYYMDLNCGRVFDFSAHGLYQINLKLTAHTAYRANMNCTLYLQSDPNDKFMLYFKYVKTASCLHAWLDVYDSNDTSTSLPGLQRNCGTLGATDVFTTKQGVMMLNFVSDNFILVDKGFDMVITAFHTGLCDVNEHECGNGRCIDKSLVCNGYNPCGDHSECSLTSGFKLSDGCIVAISFASFFGSVCFVETAWIIYNCWPKLLQKCKKTGGKGEKTPLQHSGQINNQDEQ